MYERFTDRARRVMQLANQEAQRFNHEYIGTEHVLLGLIKEGAGVAAAALANLKIDLRKVRLEVERLVQAGPDYAPDKLPLTPRVKKVVDYAMEFARGRGDNHIGTEHLLMGLLREKEGVAFHVLSAMGVAEGVLEEEIQNLLGDGLRKRDEQPTLSQTEIESALWRIHEALANHTAAPIAKLRVIAAIVKTCKADSL